MPNNRYQSRFLVWVDTYGLFIEDGFENLHPNALE